MHVFLARLQPPLAFGPLFYRIHYLPAKGISFCQLQKHFMKCSRRFRRREPKIPALHEGIILCVIKLKHGDAYIGVNKLSTKLPILQVMNLTVEGLKGSMYNLHTYFLQVLTKSWDQIFTYIVSKTSFGRLSYVKERTRIYSCVTLEIKIRSICIQGHPGHMLEPKSSITSRYSTNLKSTQLMYKLVLDRTTFTQ